MCKSIRLKIRATDALVSLIHFEQEIKMKYKYLVKNIFEPQLPICNLGDSTTLFHRDKHIRKYYGTRSPQK